MEIWKEVTGYEGYYEVSNKGNVRSCDRMVNNNGTMVFRKGKVLNPEVNRVNQLRVTLRKQKKVKRFLVHRLVAEAFIEKPESKNIVNHIDKNRLNNSVENLEWVSQRENMTHGYLGKLPTGVYKNGDNYIARLFYNGKKINLGTFKTIDEAKSKYAEALKNQKLTNKYI
ncbi:hypothetical protein CMT52_18630 [Elizabethkingia anophelis]|nr:hypothetical protein [Elizabethkingia anophelis]